MSSGQSSRRRVLAAGLSLGAAALAGCARPVPAPSTTPASPTGEGGATPAAAATLRFVVGSDAHLGQAGTGAKRRLADFVAAVNRLHRSAPLDLVVVNGDIGHGGARLLKDARRSLAGLVPPLLAVPGNHDGVSEETWREVWGAPENQVLRFGERSIVAVNTSDVRGRYLCADEDWLRSRLAEEAGQRDVFVVMHITPAKWTKFGVDCPSVRSLLAGTPNVRAVFNGHDHDQDGIRTDSGLPYLFDGRIGGDWGPAYRGFRLVEVSAGRLQTRMLSVAGEEFPQKVLTWLP